MSTRTRPAIAAMVNRLLALALSLCAASPGAAAPEQAVLRVPDDRGQHITLERPAQRIVSLAPHVTELLFAAGAGARVVGVVRTRGSTGADADLPSVGDHQSISDEAVMRLAPDLIVAWLSGNGAEVITRLERLGFTVYANEPRALEDIATALERFGVLAGTTPASIAAAAHFRERHQALRREYGNRTPVRVFYQVWNEPLMTLNGKHLVSDIIRLCSGRNVFADALPLAPRIGVEAVVRAAPDVIVAGTADTAAQRSLAPWRDWPSIPAVRDGHLYTVPPQLLQQHTTQVLSGAAALCRHLDRARTGAPE